MEENNQEYSFVRETVKERPINKKKLFRRTATTVFMAVLFGLVACLTILLIEPVINRLLNPKEIQKVEFPEEQMEIKPEQLLTEETVALQEEQMREEAMEEGRVEALQQVQEVIAQETVPRDSVEDYKTLYYQLYAIAKNSQKFMTTVTGISEREDWFAGTTENRNQTAGVIVANTGELLYILADSTQIFSSKEFYVTFCDKYIEEATLVQRDEQTGLAIFTVRLDQLPASTKGRILIAQLGSSQDDATLGKPVMAVGSPLGTSGSVSYGMVTANNNSLNVIDAAYNVIMTDMNMATYGSGVIIDMDQNVLGIMNSKIQNMGTGNTVSTIGISDIKALVEKLSNNEPRAYLGIMGMDVTEGAHIELNVPYGAYVTEVAHQSVAMKSGVQAGDVIVHLGDYNVSSFKDYRSALLSMAPNTTIMIRIMRFNGTEYIPVDVEVVLQEAP